MMKIFTRTIIVCLLGFFTGAASAQNVIYVDASKTSGTNNGTSWSNAYINLQTAIDAADGTKPIWVAKGVYFPTKQLGTTTDRRDRTFILKEGVKVYGGFAGTETEDFNLANRNFVTNKTNLSGDFTGETGDEIDEVTVVNGTVTTITKNTTNAYHVVVSYNHTPATVLDGFTVSGGNANGTSSITPLANHSFSRASGGGIYLRKSSPTLSNLIIKDNSATTTNSGAGIYINEGLEIVGSSPATARNVAISATTILNNYAAASGGGIHISGSANYSSPVSLNNVKIVGNRGTFGGGARINESVNAYFKNVNFDSNVGSNGGGIYVNSSKLEIENSAFTNNIGSNGGGLWASNTSVIISESTFDNNIITTTGGGGAINMSTDAELKIENTTLSNNKAANGNGGALYLVATALVDANNVKFYQNLGNIGGAINSSATNENNRVNNAVFFKNKSNVVGGAIAFLGSAELTLIGNTFYGNEAVTHGGAIRLGGADVDVKVYNSIFYENSGTTVDISVASGALDIQHAITQEYGTNGVNGVQIGANPQFLNVTDVNNANFLRLNPSVNNPAIDAGNNDFVPAEFDLDLAGNIRVFKSGLKDDATVDLGAYENVSTPLPVKLSDFIAAQSSNGILISWLTLSESNSSHFVLERSIDGVKFSNIVAIPSRGDGAKYDFTDISAVRGINYYRLIQVDYNGSRTVYGPIFIDFSLNSDVNVSVYPNPVTNGNIAANFGGGRFTSLELVDFRGQKLQQININADEKEKIVDFSMYPSGIYFLIFSGDSVATKKIIKP